MRIIYQFVMKKNLLLLSFLVSLFAVGCSNKDKITNYNAVSQDINDADLSVINMSTGDTVRFNGIYTGIIKKPIPKFHPYERMRLLFTPSASFEMVSVTTISSFVR